MFPDSEFFLYVFFTSMSTFLSRNSAKYARDFTTSL